MCKVDCGIDGLYLLSVHRTYREALLESTRNIKTASMEQYELVPEKTPEIAGTPVSGLGYVISVPSPHATNMI